MSNKINKTVEQIRTNLTKIRPQQHPVKEHPIDNCEEYVKMLYIDMLCVMAQYENEDTENQHKFIQRIHAGAELTEPITENIKNAMEITVERFGEFIRLCKENKLENIFFVDSLLIVCGNGTPNSKQIEFIAETADALGIEKNRAEWLSCIAAAILEQDSDKYHTACKKIPHDQQTPILECVVCYLKEFIVGILIDTDELLWIYAKEKSVWTSDEKDRDGCINLTRRNIRIENIIFNNQIKLENSDNVLIKNCKFPPYNSDFRIIIRFCENIKFVDTFFYGRKDTTYSGYIWLDNTTILNMKGCTFSDIKIDSDEYYAALICNLIESNIIMENCLFENITGGYACILYSGINKGSVAKNCIFRNCIFRNCSGTRLFFQANAQHYNIINENCELYNCCSWE